MPSHRSRQEPFPKTPGAAHPPSAGITTRVLPMHSAMPTTQVALIKKYLATLVAVWPHMRLAKQPQVCLALAVRMDSTARNAAISTSGPAGPHTLRTSSTFSVLPSPEATILTCPHPQPSLPFRCPARNLGLAHSHLSSPPLPRGACPPKADHSGRRDPESIPRGGGTARRCDITPLTLHEHLYYITFQAIDPVRRAYLGKGSKESHESHKPNQAPSTPSGMGPPGPRHAPPPLAPPYPRVPWLPHRPTEDVPNSQRSLSAHLPAAPSRRGCPRSLAADDYPRLIPTASLPHDRGCPRLVADEFPLRLPWRRSGCPRSIADEFPLRLLWRRSGCLRHCAADDLPRPDSSRSGPGRRGSAGNPHPHPVPFTPDRLLHRSCGGRRCQRCAWACVSAGNPFPPYRCCIGVATPSIPLPPTTKGTT